METEEKDKDDVIERLAQEFLKGMGEEEKKEKEAPPSEHKIMEEYEEPKKGFYPEQEEEPEKPSFKIEEPLPSFEEPVIPEEIPEPPRPFEEKIEEPSFKIEEPLPTFEVPSFEEPIAPEEIPIPSEPPRPSEEKIEEILTKLEEEERGIGMPIQPKRIEEEEEEEEFPEIPEETEEEILVKKPKKRKAGAGGRFIKFAILGCIIGGIIGGGFYLGKNYATPITNLININVIDKIFKPSCDLIVNSTPTSCDVFVNDIVKGKTPITIKLGAGDHNIRIEKEDFKPYISVVSVVSRKPINVIANLEEEVKIQEAGEAIPVGTATLIVKTSPKDSLVYIGGRLVKIPYLLLSGTHSIVVKRDGFFSSTRIIEIKEGEIKEVFIQLAPSLGSVFIDSIPRGGDVVFDGFFKGKTPLILSGISPWKPYRITLRKKGYFDWNGTTFVEPAQRTKIMAFIKKKGEEPSYEKGEREIKEKPILVEKKPFYKTEEFVPPFKIEETSPAVLELKRAIDRFKDEVKVSAPPISAFVEEPYLKREFPEIPKEKPKPQITGAAGTCFITSIPSSADIFLSGRFIGKTPIRDFIIPEGPHRLKACLVGFKEQEKEIIVRGDTANFFNFSLKN